MRYWVAKLNDAMVGVLQRRLVTGVSDIKGDKSGRNWRRKVCLNIGIIKPNKYPGICVCVCALYLKTLHVLSLGDQQRGNLIYGRWCFGKWHHTPTVSASQNASFDLNIWFNLCSRNGHRAEFVIERVDCAGFEMGDIMVAKGDPLYVWSKAAFAPESGGPKKRLKKEGSTSTRIQGYLVETKTTVPYGKESSNQ